MTSLCLIPQPIRCEEQGGTFVITAGISIVVSHRAEPGEWIAARKVQALLAETGCTAPIQPQIVCVDTSQTIVLGVRGRDDTTFPKVISPDMAIPEGPNDEGYLLTIGQDTIVIWGASPRGLVQGSRTLGQILHEHRSSLPQIRIADAPAVGWRGALLDVSRGKVPRLETLLCLVDILASYKINMLQLYTEHTFASRRHPQIGQGWGALTPEEIVALDAYCRDRYVELIPCIQSFGHMRHTLELPEYAHLAESDQNWSVTPVREETYGLLNDIYADALACFSSNYINICSDETFDLGTGQSKERATSEGLGRLYLYHILRLHELASRYGKTVMVWGDMFLHHPDIIAEVPKDIIILNWWYESADDYPQARAFNQAGLQQVICPGTSSWNTLFPLLDNARGNIRNFVRSGRQASTIGVLTTDWGDNAHPNMLGGSWYGFAYGALEAWSPERLEDAEFERRFAHLFFGSSEGDQALAAMRDLTDACSLPGISRTNGSFSREMFFEYPTNVRLTEVSAESFEQFVRMAAIGGIDIPPEAVPLFVDIVRAHRAGTLPDEPPAPIVQMAHAAQQRGFTFPPEMMLQMIIQQGTPVENNTLHHMRDLGRRALNVLTELHGNSPEQILTLDEFRLAARQITFAATKSLVGRQLAEVTSEADAPVRTSLHRQVTALKREFQDLRHEYERLWLARNKPEGRWLSLNQFDQAAHVLDQWSIRVQPPYIFQI